MKKSVLVIDDEPELREIMRDELSDEYSVFEAADGALGMSVAEKERPSVILLDLNMPNRNGFDVCRALRSQPLLKTTPIIMVTSSLNESTLVKAFELGVDDYIEKPVRFNELKARVRARIKSNAPSAENAKLTIGNLEMHKDSLEVFVSNKPIILSTLEFKILSLFLANQGKVLSRKVLLDSIWAGTKVSDRTIDTHIVSIRRKMEKSEYKISTIYGAGYKLAPARMEITH